MIAGIEPEGARLRLTVHVDLVNARGWITGQRWYAASYSLGDELKSGGLLPAQTQHTYHGPVRLNFQSGFPSGFRTEPVTVEVAGKPAAKWPSSIPMYGSLVNPETWPPGSWDNLILGQVGPWIWVALKGPGSLPSPLRALPVSWGYRVWNRLVAFNVQTGQAAEYPIPRSVSIGSWLEMETPNLTVPTLAVQGDKVWVGVGEWIGCFPAKPTLPPRVSVAEVNAPDIRSPDASYTESVGQAALDALRADAVAGAQSLASYWNRLVGAKVPGVPPFSDYQSGKLATWNLSLPPLDHGSLPPLLLWSLTFPYDAGSAADGERNELARTIAAIVASPLNFAAKDASSESAVEVLAEFHHRPPMALPGFVIRGDAYWPANG
ncbi:hypothetical protein [Alicyclobacillus sendaiensis]|uniref:hypothetical protein n=1 Tax=Alicyclobacillus sendaiensis TaxID=192387 RepID=UPI000781469E|nr:hypothetical protein [Alicyclobacillus sendaiensis]